MLLLEYPCSIGFFSSFHLWEKQCHNNMKQQNAKAKAQKNNKNPCNMIVVLTSLLIESNLWLYLLISICFDYNPMNTINIHPFHTKNDWPNTRSPWFPFSDLGISNHQHDLQSHSDDLTLKFFHQASTIKVSTMFDSTKISRISTSWDILEICTE